ncbi:hypothetical protein ACROYT_G014917 [Oculina patagonica]
MASTSRAFRKPKNAQEERKLSESATPKSTQAATKWSLKIFREWQNGRKNRSPAIEPCAFRTDNSKVQCLDTDITSTTAESLNFWQIKFAEEVCKENGERLQVHGLASALDEDGFLCRVDRCDKEMFTTLVESKALVVMAVPVEPAAADLAALGDPAPPVAPAPAAAEPAPPAGPAAAAEGQQDQLNELEALKKEIQDLKDSNDEKSVDVALRHVRQLLSRPPSIFDAFATMAALEQLADVAREKGHERANRFAIVLRQTRPLMGSSSLQQVLLKLVGSDEEVAIAKEIQKAVKQAPGVWPRSTAAFQPPGASCQAAPVEFSTFCQSYFKHRPKSVLWCDRENNPTNWAGPLPSVEMVADGQVFASPDMLRFRHPESFVAGNLTMCQDQWELISVGYDKRDFVLAVIREGVDIFDFFTPFNGTFQGKSYRSDLPPRMCFPNSPACQPFQEFITATIMYRIANGSINVIGRVNEVEPPYLVMPITVEPSKPRMCHDERFLNCWIKDCPFKLDYLTDLCRYVDPGHYQTTFDDKSGYDHICLHPRSSTFFGFQWQGWYFTYASLPFGWKASAFVYNTVGMTATHFIRSHGVPCSQYIDDRHVGQLRLRSRANSEYAFSNFQLAQMAAFIACYVVISLGYFIGLKKSCLSPSMARRFLGYVCDIRRSRPFSSLKIKKEKFAVLREAILSKKYVSL